MKLHTITIENYRSLASTPELEVQENLTVILGPNNEGKSNLLRSIILAMECLRAVREQRKPDSSQRKTSAYYRLPTSAYSWEADFPVGLQKSSPDGETVLNLKFKLSTSECDSFYQACELSINGILPLEIGVGPLGARFRVRKPGRGAGSYEQKSREIALFISSMFDFAYIPAIRPSELSLEIVGRLMDRELTTLSDNPDYRAALKTIEDLQRPALERLAAEVQVNLKQLLPTVKKVRVSPQAGTTFRSRFVTPHFIVDDGTATRLEAKGDGVKSLVAISLMRASRASTAKGDVLVAIEEPESHLHPLAVREMAEVLKEIAALHQVVITTHSPLLAVRGNVAANIVVSKSKALPATHIKQVRDALGVHISDNLSSAETVILVEGTHDITAVRALIRRNAPELWSKLDDGSLVINDLEGTSKIAYTLSTLHATVSSVVLLVDDDKAGRDCLAKAARDAKLHERFQFRWKRPDHIDTELEDLVETSVYWSAVQTEFAAKLDEASFSKSNDKWSVRMKRSFESAGKPWNDSIENSVKSIVAKAIESSDADPVAENARILMTNVLSAIQDLVARKL